MGGSLVFLFLTWHIPSVASAMMVGAVHLSLVDIYYPLMLAGRAGGVALGAAGAVMSFGRWGTGRLAEWNRDAHGWSRRWPERRCRWEPARTIRRSAFGTRLWAHASTAAWPNTRRRADRIWCSPWGAAQR